MVTITTRSVEESQSFGERLGKELGPGDVLALYGDLGAGKTTLTKGIALGLGVASEIVSPTFTLIHEHSGRIPLYHVDLYRLEDEEEIWNLGIEDYLYGGGVTIIEWAERMPTYMPKERIDLRIKTISADEREIQLEAHSDHFREIAERLASDAGTID